MMENMLLLWCVMSYWIASTIILPVACVRNVGSLTLHHLDISLFFCLLSFVVVQSLSHVGFFVIPWTAACQTSLSFTISWSLLRLMAIESVMPSNYPILCHPLLLLPSIFPALGSFLMSQLFISGSQSILVSLIKSPNLIKIVFLFTSQWYYANLKHSLGSLQWLPVLLNP